MTRPAVTYPVSLSDLCDIADAACDLSVMKGFYVDQPAMLEQIAARAERLHDIVERAAGLDEYLVYAKKDGSEVVA